MYKAASRFLSAHSNLLAPVVPKSVEKRLTKAAAKKKLAAKRAAAHLKRQIAAKRRPGIWRNKDGVVTFVEKGFKP